MMTDTVRTYTADQELTTLLKAAARAGERVRVRAGDETYIVRIEYVPESSDIWAGYDPEQLRAAVRRSAAMGTITDTKELDDLIAEIRAQRDQAPRQQ
jgi:hypothetical protein